MTARGVRFSMLIVVTAGILGLTAPQTALASCVGPQVSITVGDGGSAVAHVEGAEVTVEPGARLTVTGTWFRDGCNDTSSVGTTGCGGPVVSQGETETPMRDVVLLLTQGNGRWPLGTTDATGRADSFAIAFDVGLPTDLQPGAAVLMVGPVPVQLQVDDQAA